MFDSVAGTFRLPPKTFYRYAVHAFVTRALLDHPRLSAAAAGRYMEVFCGRMQWFAACTAVGAGKLGALHALCYGPPAGPEHFAKAAAARPQLDWWCTRLTAGSLAPLRALQPGPPYAILVSDASEGAVAGVARRAGRPWADGVGFYRRLHPGGGDAGACILARELFGLELALRLVVDAPQGSLVLGCTEVLYIQCCTSLPSLSKCIR